METSRFSLGTFLRDRRQQRGWTLAQVAQKAGVVKSTLSKWENGHVLPRLPELLTVLDVLGVTTSERALLFQRLGRSTSSPDTSDLHALPGVFPLHGDLLRAMRHRALLSQSEAAGRAQVAQGTLAKWENGTDWPSAERLHALAFVLGATGEETAVLTTGIPTYFPAENDTWEDEDLARIENEITALKTRSYFYPFAPHDLWFLSLLSRLGPPSLREDQVGQRAFIEWAKVACLYLEWLTMSNRPDARGVTQRLLERVQPRLTSGADHRLWAWVNWVVIQDALGPMERVLQAPQNFLRARQRPLTVPYRAIQRVQDLTQQLSLLAHNNHGSASRTITHTIGVNDLACALLAALEGEADTAGQIDIRIAAFQASLESGGEDVAMDRAQIHYFRGDIHRALETLPRIPPPPTSAANFTHLNQLWRLEQLRFRARALLESKERQRIEEGHHLLETFNREVIQLPMGGIRARLGPIPQNL